MYIKCILASLLIIVFISPLLPACNETNTSEFTCLKGWVSFGTPVTRASLSIYSTSGKLLFQSGEPVTSKYGSFMVGVEVKLPRNFRVVCTPSADDKVLSGIKLLADVEDFNPHVDEIHINIVTTIVGRYLDRNKDMTLKEAKESVRDFLEIPEYVDIGSGLYNNDDYFSHQVFLIEASQKGGIETFIDRLVDEMEEPGNTTHPFQKKEGVW